MSLFRVLHFDICSGRRLTFGADDVGRRLEQIRIIWKRFSSTSSRKALKIPYNKQLPRPFLWWSIEISENKIPPRQSRTFHFHSGENLKLTRKERVNSSRTHGATKNISNRISARIAGQLRGGYNVVELYPRQSATIQRAARVRSTTRVFPERAFLDDVSGDFHFLRRHMKSENSKRLKRGIAKESRESDLLYVDSAWAGLDVFDITRRIASKVGELDASSEIREFFSWLTWLMDSLCYK